MQIFMVCRYHVFRPPVIVNPSISLRFWSMTRRSQPFKMSLQRKTFCFHPGKPHPWQAWHYYDQSLLLCLRSVPADTITAMLCVCLSVTHTVRTTLNPPSTWTLAAPPGVTAFSCLTLPKISSTGWVTWQHSAIHTSWINWCIYHRSMFYRPIKQLCASF